MLLTDYNFQCEPCDYSTSEKGILLMELTYYYFLLKVLDLFDTVWKRMGFLSCLRADNFNHSPHSSLSYWRRRMRTCRSCTAIITSSCASEHMLVRICFLPTLRINSKIFKFLSCSIRSRRSFVHARHSECIRPWLHVFVLLPRRCESWPVEVCLEKENHANPDGKMSGGFSL